jgi:hypothetical protein
MYIFHVLFLTPLTLKVHVCCGMTQCTYKVTKRWYLLIKRQGVTGIFKYFYIPIWQL